LGAQLAKHLPPDAVLALAGELGAGKTAFTQGLAKGLGIVGPVTSPTFTLINEYRLPDGRRLQHVDCYRLETAPQEMWDIGLADLFEAEDLVVIEWADRIPGLLPAEHLRVSFSYLGENKRRICFQGTGNPYATLIRQWDDQSPVAHSVVTSNKDR
jgi:tRNA threonylcarbamoyladenosine biosynthesis protein TsaE